MSMFGKMQEEYEEKIAALKAENERLKEQSKPKKKKRRHNENM